MLRAWSLSRVGRHVIVLACLVTASVIGQRSVRADEQADLERVREFRKVGVESATRFHIALATTTEFEFVDMPLDEAMDFVADFHNITVRIDESALRDAEISTDAAVNLIVTDITLRSALRMACGPLGLDFIVQDEVLKITTAKVAANTLEMRVYDVRHLSEAGFEPAALAEVITAMIDARQRSQQAVTAGRRLETATSTPGKGLFSQDDSNTESAEKGVVKPMPGCLVVVQSQRTHSEIVDLLDQLKQLSSSKAATHFHKSKGPQNEAAPKPNSSEPQLQNDAPPTN